MGTIAPVAQTNAELFTKMATTFEAISHSPSDLEQTIKETPSTERSRPSRSRSSSRSSPT